MTILKRFQVLDHEVMLTDKDQERLSVWLRSYEAPYRYAKFSEANEPDLERLLIMELMGRQRRKIISRLLSRLGRVRDMRIQKRVEKLLRR